jgi:murein DD-endopeptidase MepM/ murein hydrolase activator NlpD
MLTAALVAAVPGIAGASYRSRQAELERLIENKRNQIASARRFERNLLSMLEESDLRRASLQRALDIVESKLAAARDNLRLIERSLDHTTVALHAKTGQLEATLAQLATQQHQLDVRVAQIYMSAPTTFQKAYSMARDFSDVVAANQYAGAVVRADQQLVRQVEATKNQLVMQRADIESQQRDLATKRAAAAAVTEQVTAIVRMRASARGAVLAEIAHRRVILAGVRSHKREYIRALNNLVAESNSISALLRGAQRGQRVIQGYGGYLKWPVSGRITSPFGWRVHPIYHYRSFHTGIDIGVPSGTRVHAARRGTVIYTGYKGAYGLIVIIDHGNSLATVYAHLSRVFVRSGESVSTQEVVAASGNTGWSTGPHLHFEVRVNGTPVNPVRWL